MKKIVSRVMSHTRSCNRLTLPYSSGRIWTASACEHSDEHQKNMGVGRVSLLCMSGRQELLHVFGVLNIF